MHLSEASNATFFTLFNGMEMEMQCASQFWSVIAHSKSEVRNVKINKESNESAASLQAGDKIEQTCTVNVDGEKTITRRN